MITPLPSVRVYLLELSSLLPELPPLVLQSHSPDLTSEGIALLPSMRSYLLELQFPLPDPLLSLTLKHLQSLLPGSPSLGTYLSLPLLCCLQPLFQLLTILSLLLPMPILLNSRGSSLNLHLDLNHFDLLVLPLL